MMLLAWHRSRRARAPLFAGLLRPPHTDQAGRVTQHERGKGGVESSPYARVARPSTPPASPAFPAVACSRRPDALGVDRKSTRLNSSHANISYAVFCLKKKKQ